MNESVGKNVGPIEWITDFILSSAAADVIGFLATTILLIVAVSLRHAIFRKVVSHRIDYDEEFSGAELSAFLGAGTISIEISSFKKGRLSVQKATVDERIVDLRYLDVGAKFYKLGNSKIEIRVSSILRLVPKSEDPTEYDILTQFRVPRF